MTSLIKYKKSFSIGVANSLEYRFDFFMGLISTVFPIIIQVFLWTAIYGNSGKTVLYGYAFSQMIMYVFIAGAVSQFVVTCIENVINDDIHSGGLAKFLIQPVSYVPFRMLGVIGQKIASMVTIFVLTGILVVTLGIVVKLSFEPVKVLLFIPALALAVILNFFIFFTISISAFWLTEIGNFFHAIRVAVMVISGGVFPIEVMGSSFVRVMKWLPFIYTTNFPIRVITGTVSVSEILWGGLIQILWIALLAGVSKILWHIGVKKYVAVGG
jgi:ABC-2 type transport system permease protein